MAKPLRSSALELTNGEGARRFGGRWNPPGIAAIYTSLDLSTPTIEAKAHAARFGIQLRSQLPVQISAIHVELQAGLDLTNGRIRRRLGLGIKRLLSERWWEPQTNGLEPLTHLIGRAAYLEGFEALLVNCAPAPSHVNLVVFPENVLPGSLVRAHPRL